jgi:hypothetical protein
MKNRCHENTCGLATVHTHGGEWFNLPDWADVSDPISSQRQRIESQLCHDPNMVKGGTPNPHMVHLVYTKRWRDWLRKRSWWRCWTCELMEEVWE